MRLTLTLVLILALALILASAAGAHKITRIPARCTTRLAPRLCATHFHRDRTNQLRAKAHTSRLVYEWMAERHPARRDHVLALWMHRQGHARQLLRAFQHSQRSTGGLPSDWLRNALCVHHYEGAWNANTGNGYYGGMQFDLGTWQSNGGSGMPNLASPAEQLRIAYRTWQSRGWSPWPTTAAICGLL